MALRSVVDEWWRAPPPNLLAVTIGRWLNISVPWFSHLWNVSPDCYKNKIKWAQKPHTGSTAYSLGFIITIIISFTFPCYLVSSVTEMLNCHLPFPGYVDSLHPSLEALLYSLPSGRPISARLLSVPIAPSALSNCSISIAALPLN